jgi:hydroxymethylpyrimidine/phosphomethylpyrimidine kinase
METPVAITIAGSDSSSGAGIQADLKTFYHFGIYAQTVITCVVAEVPGVVSSIQPITLETVRSQLELSLVHFPVAVIKTGMLFSPEIIELVTDSLEDRDPRSRPPIIVDPVMIATSGDPLIRFEAIQTYVSRLLPLASLVTPNVDEAAILLDRPLHSLDELQAGAIELYERFQVPFLLKGGHLKLAEATDLLVDRNGVHRFSEPYQQGIPTHGTGCTYSAAIAANLALHLSLHDAVAAAKRYISAAIRDSFRWNRNGKIVFALRH